jgi:hypothetical protein
VIEGILAAAQGWAEQKMLDTCTITRVTGKTFNETTKLYVPTTITVYSGPCELKQEARAVETASGPGQVEQIQRGILKLPIAESSAVQPGDDVLMVTSLNPGLVGLRAKVRGGHYQSAASARRLPIEVVS